MNKRIIFSIIALATILFSAGSAFAASTPQTYVPGIYEPNPSMNGNITWSSFHNGWTPLEYNNGTANTTLNTGFSQYYANPITVNPLDIQSNQLYATSDGYNNTANWTTAPTATFGSSLTQHIVTSTTQNGHSVIQFQTNATSNTTTQWTPFFDIPFAKYPSNNLMYDYITLELTTNTSITASGQSVDVLVQNTTGGFTVNQRHINITNDKATTGTQTNIYPTNTLYFTAPIGSFAGENWNNTASDGICIQININMPKYQSTNLLTVTVQTLQLTTAPLYLGTTAINQTNVPAYANVGNTQLQTLSPDFQWSAITNSGYSVAVSQKMSDLTNVTVSQAAISSGNYVEQVTYGASFSLPGAPDLTYKNFNLTQSMSVPGSQFIALDVNGVSYSSQVSNQTTNKTFGFGAVNPQDPSYFAVVDYTESQWNSISSSPGIFTIAGIEYYYWLAVGALIGVLGIGAGAKHSANVRAEQLRGRK